MKKSLILGMAAGAAGVALAGCFDVEQSVSLKRDLSGTAGFNMTVDLEPMIAFMASMQHSMAGKPGEPTPAEIEAARRDFLAKQKTDPGKKQEDLAAQKAQLAKSLPPGVELLSASVEDQGTKMTARFQFGFDDVRKLAQIKLPEKGSQGKSGSNPYEDPFSQLKVIDEGPTVLVTLGSINPAARLQEQAGQGGMGKDGGNPEMAKAVEAAFKGARFAFRLDTPFEVVETNATRRDGRTLYWEVRAADPDVKMPPTLMARLKK
jgi:hypothetical protein